MPIDSVFLFIDLLVLGVVGGRHCDKGGRVLHGVKELCVFILVTVIPLLIAPSSLSYKHVRKHTYCVGTSTIQFLIIFMFDIQERHLPLILVHGVVCVCVNGRNEGTCVKQRNLCVQLVRV